MKDKLVKPIDKLEGILRKYYIVIIVFAVASLNYDLVYASSFDTSVFTGIIDMMDSVLKVAGVAIGLIGIARFAISFAQDNPETRYNSIMQITAGVLLFAAKSILESLGLIL